MANASCATCTLVSNVLTVVGSVSGTILVGMTLTGASVPPGVTISSQGTGTGGAGTYNCTSSGANIPTAEPMVFSLSWDMPLQGNSSAPQLMDMGRAAGFGLIFCAAFGAHNTAPAAEYVHGTHAAAIYNAQAQSGTQVFHATSGKQGRPVVPTILTQPQYPEPRPVQVFQAQYTKLIGNLGSSYQFGTHQVALYNSQIQSQVFMAAIAEPLGSLGSEYTFGTHAKAIYDSQIQAQVFKPVPTPPGGTTRINPRAFVTPPQNVDLTIQGWSKIPSVTTGWLVTMVTAGPQLADLTVQAKLTPSRPFSSAFHGPTSPATIFSVAQADPAQIGAKIIAPPLRVAPIAPKQFVSGAPDLRDYTQPQGRLMPAALPGPSKFFQPTFVFAYEQQYDKNVYPLAFQPAIQVGGAPPISTGFRVTAVTAGFYQRFRTPGDVFDLVSAADYSDSTVNYQDQPTLLRLKSGGFLLLRGGGRLLYQVQTEGSTSGYGWMLRVPQTTPLFDWLQSNGAPYLPPQDPRRRFIY